MEIRRPRASEQAIVQAFVQGVIDEVYGGQWAPAPLAIGLEDWTQGWVAVDGDRVVGVMMTGKDWLDDLWLAPAVRGTGLGATLLERAEAEIAARGYSTAILRVVVTNERAQRFYARHGWQRSRQYRHEKHPIDMVEFSKQLG